VKAVNTWQPCLLIELSIEAENGGSKDMVEKFEGVFIKFPIKKTKGIPKHHPGEEWDNKGVIQIEPENA